MLAPAREAQPEAVVERRETSGVTSRLILSYVERERGREGAVRLLALAGLLDEEELLRDENHWFSWEKKIAMLEAAVEVLGDPRAGRRIGGAGLDFNLAHGVKLSLRALGTPRLIYKNIVRASSKFTLTHRMESDTVGKHHARIRYLDTSGRGYHPQDCELNIGYLSSVPVLFGLPPARISHPVCARDGGDTCVYEVHWESGASRMRRAVAAVFIAAGAVGGSLALAPDLVAPAAGLGAALTAHAGISEARFRRARYRLLERRAEHNAAGAERLESSLRELVSELRIDEVLEKVTANAQAAVGGKEFALLVADGDRMRCRSSSELPAATLDALERWAARRGDIIHSATLLDDLSEVPELLGLPLDPEVPLRSICAAPLVFRGRRVGLLVSLANGAAGFLPNDVTLLESYAVQAAIALTNAQMFEAQQALASRDPLTELFNHREFHESIARELERCRRHGGTMGLVMFDLDGFKLVNDTRGHAAGDLLLKTVAQALAESTRAGDMAFRIGGDEFALLLPEASGHDAVAAAERAAALMAAVDDRVGVSYGVAEWPHAGPSKDSLLACADMNLYAMKREGSSVGTRASGLEDGAEAARQDANRQRQRLAAARRLSAQLAPLRDPVAVARATVDELTESFGWFLTVVHRLDALDDVLRPLAAAGRLVELMGGVEDWVQSASEGVNGRAARTGEPVVVPDTARDPDFMAPVGVELVSRSELAVPLRVRGEIFGVLNIESLEPDAFGPDDLAFADLLAGHVGAALDRTRLFAELETTLTTTLAVLSDALERKDAYTAAHADEVADLTVRVGRRLGFTGDGLRTLNYGGLLHDIGKIGIRSEILQKPGPLTNDEFEEIKQHSSIGADMLVRIPFFADVVPLVRYAHERWDGNGYPAGLIAESIPLGARVICACDAYNAMISERPYKAAMPVADAIAELRRGAGTQFDPVVVDALIADLAEQSRPARLES